MLPLKLNILNILYIVIPYFIKQYVWLKHQFQHNQTCIQLFICYRPFCQKCELVLFMFNVFPRDNEKLEFHLPPNKRMISKKRLLIFKEKFHLPPDKRTISKKRLLIFKENVQERVPRLIDRILLEQWIAMEANKR